MRPSFFVKPLVIIDLLLVAIIMSSPLLVVALGLQALVLIRRFLNGSALRSILVTEGDRFGWYALRCTKICVPGALLCDRS
jgi:hypothetical protein